MEIDKKESALEAAEKEITNIVNKRATTFLESRLVALNKELEVTRNEAAVKGMGRSGPLIKKTLEMRSQAVRDIVLERFKISKALHSEHRIPWTEESLGGLAADLNQWTEGKFSAEKKSLQEEVSCAFKPDDQIVKWAMDEIDRERDKLSAEISREIDAMRSETKLRAMSEGRRSDQTPTIQINISGGQVGVLNAGTIHTIEQNLSTVNEAGQKDLVEAIKALTETVISSKDLSDEQTREALENLEFLSRQAALPAENRSKSGVVSAIVGHLRELISTAKDLSDLWTSHGSTLLAALQSIGMLLR